MLHMAQSLCHACLVSDQIPRLPKRERLHQEAIEQREWDELNREIRDSEAAAQETYDQTWRPAFPPEPEQVDIDGLLLFGGGVVESRDGKTFIVPLEGYLRPYTDWIGHEYDSAYPQSADDQLYAMEEDPIIITHGEDWDLDPSEVYLVGRARGFVMGFERGIARGIRDGSEETVREYRALATALVRKWKRRTLAVAGLSACLLLVVVLWAMR